MTTDCNSEAVIQQLETIVTLKKLRSKVEEGKTHLPISLSAINEELENQRHQMEKTIAQCGGNMEGIPDQAIEELAEESSLEPEPLPELESLPESLLEPEPEPEIPVFDIASEGG